MLTVMKKYLVFFAAVSFAALAVSCSVERSDVPELTGKVILSATVEDALSKAAVDEEGLFTWSSGDKILVYAKSSDSPYVTAEFSLISGENTGKAKFSGELPEGYTVDQAFYPSSFVIGEDVSTMEISLPSSYDYEPGKVKTPMSAELDSDAVLAFKHLCGVISVSITDVPADAAKIVLTTPGKKITGSALNISSVDGISQINATDSNSGNTITVEVTPGAYTSVSTLIPVPVGTYESLSVAVAKADGTVIVEKKAYVANTVARKGILAMPAFSVNDESGITDIKTGKELVDFLAATSADDTGKYRIVADLDMTGLTVTPAEGFAGTLDGRNHKIKNLSVSGPLFTKNTGTIKNIVVDSSSKLEVDCSTLGDSNPRIAFLVNENRGVIEACINNGSVNVTGNIAAESRIAGLMATSLGVDSMVKDCQNNGDITVSCGTGKTGYYGGVVAALSTGATDVIRMTGCTNTGNLKIVFTGKPGNSYIGGVVGGTIANTDSEAVNNGTVVDCHNTGNIYYEIGTAGNGTYTDIGGVAGYLEGSIEKCDNTGSVTYKTPDGTTNCTRPAAGGVAGYVLYSVKDCVNKGSVSLSGTFAAGTAGNAGAGGSHQVLLGGVVAGVGHIAYSETEIVSGCRNEGEVSIDAHMQTTNKTESYEGGVVGFLNVPLTDCHNTGKLNLKPKFYKHCIGGVVGKSLQGSVENSTNAGELIADMDCPVQNGNYSYQYYVGGVLGFINTSGDKITNCANSGSVTMTNGWNTAALSYVGGILGSYNAGSSMTECVNSGEIISTTASAVCVGGIAGAFNGTMDKTINNGKVSVDKATIAAGKVSEIGGLIGYANAVIKNCESNGPVDNKAAGTVSSNFVGSHGATARAWEGNKVTSTVTTVSPAAVGAILGWFRSASSNGVTAGSETNKTVIASTAKVDGAAITVDNLLGDSTNGTLDVTNVEIQ